MSGARDVFSEDALNLIEIQCLFPDINNPSEQLGATLYPLREAFKAGATEKLIDVVEAALVVKEPSKSKSESELVKVWSYVLNALALAGNKLTLRS
ncbi:hypothetical protein BGZ51_000256 [Haplosporangium sp. Z 767]|nr:hypothetical protein BGZ51_000256 [Haplosporangium sp. Z 767]